jgi:hypothetical protein
MVRAKLASLYDFLFSDTFKSSFERLIIWLAIIGFLLHLGLISLVQFELIQVKPGVDLLDNYLQAIYTPFSFILIQEIYLLIYHLPQSFTTSLAKQYEIISLILIRRIFKDISKLELQVSSLSTKLGQQLLVDMIGALVLFFLVYWFYRLKKRKPIKIPEVDIRSFILWKRVMAVLLFPVLGVMMIIALYEWMWEAYQYSMGALAEIVDTNEVFYDEFFMILVLVDVFILILSLRYTHNFAQIMRNSGFIISTMLIRLSFQADPIVNTSLVVAAVLFGVVILWIYNRTADLEEA